MKTFTLKIVSQEKELLTETVDSVSVPTTSGEITILPEHIPLFSKVKTGELVYRTSTGDHSVVVTNGFVNVSPDGEVTVMVDSGVLARDISVEKASKAIDAAHETMLKTQNQRELILAEASLRRAMMELRVAQKTHKQRN